MLNPKKTKILVFYRELCSSQEELSMLYKSRSMRVQSLLRNLPLININLTAYKGSVDSTIAILILIGINITKPKTINVLTNSKLF